MKVRMVHAVEYEVEISDDTLNIEELIEVATAELVHTGTVGLVALQTGTESWKCSGFSS